MTLAIDADCALAYWMSEHAEATQRKRASSETLLERIESGNLPDWAYAPDGTVHVVVTDEAARYRRRGIKSRLQKATLPAGSYTFTSEGIPIVSPECCFLRAARGLSIPELSKVGMMLCSHFAFDESGCLVGYRKPRTTVADLIRYIERVSDACGVKKARKAVRYIVDGAASPAEINACLLFVLPYRLGGLACPIPELNGRVELSSEVERSLGYSDCFCDLIWRKQKCVVEYTSELYHTGYQKQTRDEMRRAALEAMGYRVHFLMKNQLYNQVAFEGIARSVTRALNRRYPKSSIDYQEKVHALRETLLYKPSWIFDHVR